MLNKSFKFSLVLIAILVLISSCDQKKSSSGKNSITEYNSLVSAFTSGLISNQSNIVVRLSFDSPDVVENAVIEQNIFDISPTVEGKAYWVDNRTLEFRPAENLPSGTEFKVELKLSRLLDKKSDDFSFGFNTIPLNLNVEFKGLKAYSKTDLQWNGIEGDVFVSDVMDVDVIEKILFSEQNGQILPIEWDHVSDKKHHFTIDSVERKETSGEVNISWDGKDYDLKVEGSRDYHIPALGEFVFMEHKIIQQPEQYISLIFSDPVNNSQALAGLISLDNNSNLNFSVQDNEIKVYPNVRQYGKLNLSINPGIKNILGYKYKESNTLSLNFEELKPAVRLIGNGVIIPNSEGLLFPFEAVNLKAVDVRIIKIYEDNVAQFLQVNSLNGNYQFKRAGRLILKKTVDLIPERPINFGSWNAFSLDLTDLINTDPGAIYNIELSFRKKHSLYSCSDSDPDNENLADSQSDFEKINEKDLYYWDAIGGNYDYDYEYSGYNWNEIEDPCTDSYFNYYNRKVSRNILASNMGIIAKSGQDKSMLFAVTDLRTAEALSGVKLEIFNYQQQLLASLSTNNDGIAEIKLDNQPYLLLASKDDQRAYLKLDNSSALSLNQFDISGAYTRKGIKGYIYGERGVWRPGDSIFINFILEDKENNLPDDHPVSFELRDPLGKIRSRKTLNHGIGSFYSFQAATSQDDPTGNWGLTVKVGAVSFHKNLRIETVKPNRLKIKLDFGEDIIYSGSESLKGKLELKWLHGAIAKNLKARVDVNFKNAPTHFEDFKEYNFSDRSKRFIATEKQIFNAKVNSLGEAIITPDLDMKNSAPGMLKAVFTTRAFEEGGDFSIDQFSIDYSPYSVYTGIKKPKGNRYGMLATDSLHRFELATVDEFGNGIARKNIEVRVFKLNWRWWWHSSNENLASYTGNPEKYSVFTTRVSTAKTGKGSFNLKIDNSEWGRYLLYIKDKKSGHSSTEIVYFDWPDTGGRSSRKDPQAASILPFSSDKKKYEVGETATVSIPTSGDGRVFLSIENGTKVIDHYWIKASGEETSFSFSLTPEMAPNVFVNVSLIQPHGQTKNDLPIRMYGVIPILVEDPNTHLSPQIKLDDVFEPETTTRIEVSEKEGKEMSYTLAIVDEGLLDLTRFPTPDPWRSFYAREALGVSTFDMYNFVLGAFGGRIDGVFSIGGGMDEEASDPKKSANRFPPMVKFVGPFHLKAGKSAKHDIDIPNYIGSVRVMVIAGESGAYGTAEATVPVRKPLMVLSTLPRVLGPGEELDLPVTVFAMEDFVKKAKIEIEASDLFEIENRIQEIEFEEIGDMTVDFKLKIKEKTGIGTLRVNVSSGKEKAFHEIEIEVRSPNPEVTEFVYGMVEQGESWENNFVLPGMEGTNTAVLEVFSIPPFDYSRRLKGLIRYPHGCIEQTTSAAFPQLYLTDIMEANEEVKKKTESNVKEAIKKIGNFILPSGGFGYWQNSTLENDWGTSYAGHFLLEAKTKAYDVPEEWLKDWVKYQSKIARKWNDKRYESKWQQRSMQMSQAYRLYTLALAGKAELGAMNRLRENPNLSGMAKWHLCSAYAMAGQEEVAREILKNTTTNAENYVSANMFTYGSGLRDKAIMLEAMSLLKEKEMAIPVMEFIAEKLGSSSWYSTQTTSYCLMSVAKFIGANNTSKEINFNYAWNGNSPELAATKHPVASIEKVFSKERDGNIKIENKGEGVVFVRLALSGTPLAGEEKASANNLMLSVEYKTLAGRYLDVSKLEQGTDFIAVVRLSNPGSIGYYSDLALSQIFPSGWEIQNMRLFETNIGSYNQPDYQDIRDDRIYSYFNLGSGAQKSFAVKLTAAYCGKYYLPGISCKSMYRNDIQAVVPGKWVEISKP